MPNTILTTLMVATAAAFIGSTTASTPAPTPTGSRCIDVKPICDPGKHPICICESDISLDCHWICASPGAH
jgi:hypothetical protein